MGPHKDISLHFYFQGVSYLLSTVSGICGLAAEFDFRRAGDRLHIMVKINISITSAGCNTIDSLANQLVTVKSL